ncbi:hypothetical protein DSM3645_25247 [Blastopirellula marina DSM 3645]|uniref:Uncharacterized protein n=1 Tax=Blastopirellula marina DSM 3645 TaxID=314230 RepID=A4A0B7_9BACT|nr:hypothetical protein DSM3645_25247 [Blastopirellula marina DSM 3645]
MQKLNLVPQSKQNWGTWLSEFTAALRGEVKVADEVTIVTDSGVRVRVDMVVRNFFTGALRFIESKFGPSAEYQPNQRTGYPELMRTQQGTIRTDKLSGLGIRSGDRIGIDLQIDGWNGFSDSLP